MVKLLAGNYNAPVNVKSHGGYTPLHLACQFGHQVSHLLPLVASMAFYRLGGFKLSPPLLEQYLLKWIFNQCIAFLSILDKIVVTLHNTFYAPKSPHEKSLD